MKSVFVGSEPFQASGIFRAHPETLECAAPGLLCRCAKSCAPSLPPPGGVAMLSNAVRPKRLLAELYERSRPYAAELDVPEQPEAGAAEL